MYKNKRVLLIAGGGTLGTYASEALLERGYTVDVLCPEEKTSENKNLTFYREYASPEVLRRLFSEKVYDGIIDFLHYHSVDEYKPYHKLLSENTEQLIFLSSYRVYADKQHPITESAPLLADVIRDDEAFLTTEDYAMPKTRCEAYLREESEAKNFTIVRPVISSSERRFDVVTVSGHEVLTAAAEGRTVLLPKAAQNLTAGLDWAGNSGRLIADLLFREGVLGETYTVSSAQNLTWGEVAEMYTSLVGTKFEWVDTEDYVKTGHGGYILFYDRLYDRAIDNRKILKATGHAPGDFVPIEEGIRRELEKLKKR